MFKELGKAFLVGTILFLVIGVIEYFSGVRINDGKELLIKFLITQLYTVTLYMANAFLIRYFMERYKGEFFKFVNLLKEISGSILVSLICLFFLSAFVEIYVNNHSIDEFWAQQSFEYYFFSTVISIVITLIFYSFYYYKHRQDTKVKEQKIIAGTASAKFDALKNQLDPHFLFNSLNVLTSLIEENPTAATKFTTSLSKVYRYVLEQKNKELVTVEEELEFAQLYMTLIKMRFEDSIVFSIPTAISNPEAKVVPLSLQLLLENAVKHNQVTPTKKLYITIYEENGNLVIKNNVQPKQVVKASTGVGLRNIRQRYYLLTNRPVTIHQDEKEFSISIPMLTKESYTMSRQEDYLETKRYERAKEHVNKLKGFYGNLGMYLIFIPIFIWLNIRSGTGFPWAIFPIAGWGIGVLAHAAETFNWNPFFGKDWEERKIRELMDDEN